MDVSTEGTQKNKRLYRLAEKGNNRKRNFLVLRFFPHDIERATKNLSMNVFDVEREQSDGHEENAHEEHDKDSEIFRIGEG